MPLNPIDVLVVDDRPETIGFIVDFLLARCHKVDTALNGREALALIQRRRQVQHEYRLIIADFVMPEMDGLALLRELRQRHDDTPYAIMTAYRALNPALEIDARRLNCLAILDKPVDLRQLEETFTAALRIFDAKEAKRGGDQPFFGTSRLYRASGSSKPPPPQAESPMLEPNLRQRAVVNEQPAALPAAEPMLEPNLRQNAAVAPSPADDDLPWAQDAPATTGGALERPKTASWRSPDLAPTPTPAPAPPSGSETTGLRRNRTPAMIQAPPSGAASQGGQGSSTAFRTPGAPAAPSGRPGRVTSSVFAPPASGGTTSTARQRRSLDGMAPPPQQPAASPPAPDPASQPPIPVTSMTARIRRGMAGPPAPAPAPDAAPPAAMRSHACVVCKCAFNVPVKAEAFSAVCIYCGHMQRIEGS
jgi:CheY-like chemotaxis protein